MTTDNIMNLVSNDSCCGGVLVSLIKCNSDLAPLAQTNTAVKAPEGVPMEGVRYIS